MRVKEDPRSSAHLEFYIPSIEQEMVGNSEWEGFIGPEVVEGGSYKPVSLAWSVGMLSLYLCSIERKLLPH